MTPRRSVCLEGGAFEDARNRVARETNPSAATVAAVGAHLNRPEAAFRAAAVIGIDKSTLAAPPAAVTATSASRTC